VINYLQLLSRYIEDGRLKIDRGPMKDISITFHDPCYLGRANDIYSEPRSIVRSLTGNFTEMKRNKSFALCCGAGGGQMFKEAEKGNKEVFIERTEEALDTKASLVATACPFCMTMMTDGLKYKNKEEEIKNLDIAELVAKAMVE
jgi:heterodisulfide reductase subunit D